MFEIIYHKVTCSTFLYSDLDFCFCFKNIHYSSYVCVRLIFVRWLGKSFSLDLNRTFCSVGNGTSVKCISFRTQNTGILFLHFIMLRIWIDNNKTSILRHLQLQTEKYREFSDMKLHDRYFQLHKCYLSIEIKLFLF